MIGSDFLFAGRGAGVVLAGLHVFGRVGFWGGCVNGCRLQYLTKRC